MSHLIIDSALTTKLNFKIVSAQQKVNVPQAFCLRRSQRGLFGYYLFPDFFFCEILERVVNIWSCVAFWKTINALRLGTPAIVTLFLLQTDPGPHQRREKLCGPHRKEFGDPCST